MRTPTLASLLTLLGQPFPTPDLARFLRNGLAIGAFVFAFLLFFRPFGLVGIPLGTFAWIVLGYGLATPVSMTVFSIIVLWVLRLFNQIRDWTLGRELVLVAGNFFVVGLANLLYSAWMFDFPLDWAGVLMFQSYTLGIGFFPVAAFTYLRYQRLNQWNVDTAAQFNTRLATAAEKVGQEAEVPPLTFSSDLKEEDWHLAPRDFLYAEAADNYVDVYYLHEGQPKRRLLRTTLSKMDQEAEAVPSIVRTHRSFLINLHHVADFEGNAQGLRLHLTGADAELPVSRKMVEAVRGQLGK